MEAEPVNENYPGILSLKYASQLPKDIEQVSNLENIAQACITDLAKDAITALLNLVVMQEEELLYFKSCATKDNYYNDQLPKKQNIVDKLSQMIHELEESYGKNKRSNL